MTTPFIGEIRPFGFNFAPINWMLANGQLIPISQNTPLFSILGTTYGGNGTTNFALPNLNGSIPVGNGTGPGLTPRDLGEVMGTETVSLLITELPFHNHTASTKNAPGDNTNMTDTPAPGYFVTRFVYAGASAANAYLQPSSGPIPTPTALHPTTLSFTGGSLPHNNLQPLLVLNWCICVRGVFPARN